MGGPDVSFSAGWTLAMGRRMLCGLKDIWLGKRLWRGLPANMRLWSGHRCLSGDDFSALRKYFYK